MRNNKFWLAVIVGAVVIFLLGWVFYGMLMMNFMKAHAGTATGVERNPPIFWALFLSHLVWSFLLCTVFTRWSDITTISAGAIRAATLAFLASVSIDFVWLATTHVWHQWAAMADVVTWTVINAIAGSIIAWILGMGKKPQVAS